MGIFLFPSLVYYECLVDHESYYDVYYTLGNPIFSSFPLLFLHMLILPRCFSNSLVKLCGLARFVNLTIFSVYS